MTNWLNGLRVKTSLAILVALMILGMSTIAGIVLVKSRAAILSERRTKLENLVDSASAVPEHFYDLQRRGTISEAEAKAQAREVLRNVRFDKVNYIFIFTGAGEYVLSPMKPEWEGHNKSDMQDTKGTFFIKAMMDVANKDKSGFVGYQFPRPGGKDPVAKLSHVKLFEPWGWVVGAGIYVDDLNATFWADATVCLGILAVLLSAATGFSILVGRGLMRQLGAEPAAAREIVRQVAAGNLDVDIPIKPNDTFSLVAATGGLRDRLRDFVAEQHKLSDNHEAGVIGARMDDGKFPGVYGAIGRQINSLIDGHVNVQKRVMQVIEQYAHGDFSAELEPLPGERAAIKAAVDGVQTNLKSLNGDLMALVAAAGRGDFTVRGDENKYQYDFRKMIEGLNRLMQVSDTGLNEVVRVLGALAKGDLTENIINEYSGTFGQLKKDSNQTTARLSEIVGRLRVATETINSASKEIASGNMDLSQRTEEQAANLEQTAASMEELTSTVTQNAANATQANLLVIGASEVAVKGGAVVGQVVETMSSIKESSKKIVEIISVIDGIAFQTNILALNAAVEAARAGDQGRGFAVVASEVRSLAQRSAAAAEEIKKLIGDSVGKVDTGTRLVAEAGRTMGEIVSAVKRVTDIMGEITVASQEQSTGIEQVNLAVTQMDSVTQQNAALVEQAAAAAESLAEQADVLAQAVSVFKVVGFVVTGVTSTGRPSPDIKCTPGPNSNKSGRPSAGSTFSGACSPYPPGAVGARAQWGAGPYTVLA